MRWSIAISAGLVIMDSSYGVSTLILSSFASGRDRRGLDGRSIAPKPGWLHPVTAETSEEESPPLAAHLQPWKPAWAPDGLLQGRAGRGWRKKRMRISADCRRAG
jgi:hypothetical protein